MSEISTPAPEYAFVPVEGKTRERTVTLDWPLQYGDRRIDVLAVRRMTVAQVDAFLQEVKSGGQPSISSCMVSLPDGEPVPPGLLAALDDDDDARLYEAIQDFLPQRLRRVLGSNPPSADDTSQPSQAD